MINCNIINYREKQNFYVFYNDKVSKCFALIQYVTPSVCGKQSCRFLLTYYSDFPFIEYSVSRDAIFCFPCRMFQSDCGKAERSFTVTGVPSGCEKGSFRNWKKIVEKLNRHASECSIHLTAIEKWNSWKQSQSKGDIITQLQTHTNEVVSQQRKAVSTLSRIVLFCAKQDLALRGHRENTESDNEISNRGNFFRAS